MHFNKESAILYFITIANSLDKEGHKACRQPIKSGGPNNATIIT